jgi:hypothetical protein
MKARTRRRLALTAGCLAGTALGALASTINPYMQAAMLHMDANLQDDLWSFSLWFPCLAVGTVLGAALAAVIPDDPKPDRT